MACARLRYNERERLGFRRLHHTPLERVYAIIAHETPA